MHSYSDALNKELKTSTLDKTIVRAHEESSKKKDEVWNIVLDHIQVTRQCTAFRFFHSCLVIAFLNANGVRVGNVQC